MYFNAPLSEGAWLELPAGNIVRVLDAIYGFKQLALKCGRSYATLLLALDGKSSRYAECTNYCYVEDGRIAVFMACVDGILLVEDFKEGMQQRVNHLMQRHKERDFDAPDEGTKLDQALYASSIVVEGMRYTDVRKVSTVLDPGIDISTRQDHGEELDSSRFPYTRISGKLMFLVKTTRPACSVSLHSTLAGVTTYTPLPSAHA